MIKFIFKSRNKQKMCRIQQIMCAALAGSPAYMGIEICVPPEDLVTTDEREADIKLGWHFQELLVGNSNSHDIEIELPDCETIDWEEKIKSVAQISEQE